MAGTLSFKKWIQCKQSQNQKCHHFGKQGCYLDGSLYSLEHSQAHNGPGSQQTAHHVRVERARLVNRVCDVQSVTVPEV